MRIIDSGWTPALTRALDSGIDRTLPAIAQEWVDHVQQRTKSGRAVDGSRFPPKANGEASNLVDSGRMVESFAVQRLDRNGFVLAPTDRRNLAVAYIHQHRGRPWIGVDDRTVREARDRIAEAAIPRNRR